jgi:hypothetical protein
MNLIVKFFKALQKSRQIEADRVIRSYGHLVEQAHAYDRRRASEATANNVERRLERAFITG